MKKKTKTLRFSVRLSDVGPESRKRLRSIGLDKNLTIFSRETTFTDHRGRGFNTAAFWRAVDDARDDAIREAVECVISTVRKRKRKS